MGINLEYRYLYTCIGWLVSYPSPMRGVRYIPDKGLKGKLRRFNDTWLVQHEAQGKRLKRYCETQTAAVLQRLQWENDRTQAKRGRVALPSQARTRLCSILSNT
ncbi:hypothetical protein VPH526E571_0018 [Vibrio phage 526E57-1]